MSIRTAARRFYRPNHAIQAAVRGEGVVLAVPWSPTTLPQAGWCGRSNAACLPASPITWSIRNAPCAAAV